MAVRNGARGNPLRDQERAPAGYERQDRCESPRRPRERGKVAGKLQGEAEAEQAKPARP
jgi:hypothetical protein